MPLRGNGEPSQEELMQMQQEQEREREERQMANQMASSAAMDGKAAQPGYWQTIGEPDIESGIEEFDDHLEAFTSVELSNKFALANITHDDWESWCWRTENEFWVITNEFTDPDCKMDSVDMATMGYEDAPALTDQRARKLKHTQSVKKAMTSLSIDARGLRSGTEIHAVARNESDEPDEEDSSGFFSRTAERLV